MKILYVTTVGGTMRFFKDFINDLLQEGHKVDIICNETETSRVPEYYTEWGCRIYHHSAERTAYSTGLLKAIKEIRALVMKNGYDLVHCHTPIAAMCTRLACKKLRKYGNLRVFYTAHGFHFYKGAPLKNWMIYYPIEKICSYFTDVLITINREDYELAKKKMKAKQVNYIPGVGIDLSNFQNVSVDRNAKRREIGVPVDSFLLFSVGELNSNKNHQLVIKALAKLNDQNVHYAIAGVGNQKEALLDLAGELDVSKQVHLLGYRKDIAELNHVADLFCFPSYREGLPVALMEAMACGLPVVAARNRGTIDLINYGDGELFSPDDVEACCQAILHQLHVNTKKTESLKKDVMQNYSVDNIVALMRTLYEI